MKYRVGDLVVVVTEIRSNGNKYILLDKPSDNSKLIRGTFQIVAKNEIMHTYKIIIDDDMVGWQISQFHINHEGVPKAFNGKKFYDIHEDFVLGLKKG